MGKPLNWAKATKRPDAWEDPDQYPSADWLASKAAKKARLQLLADQQRALKNLQSIERSEALRKFLSDLDDE